MPNDHRKCALCGAEPCPPDSYVSYWMCPEPDDEECAASGICYELDEWNSLQDAIAAKLAEAWEDGWHEGYNDGLGAGHPMGAPVKYDPEDNPYTENRHDS